MAVSVTEEGEVDLYAPVTSDVILEVRSGRMKNLKGLKVQSGIDKTLCDGPVKVGPEGIEGDEHDYTFHGGVDKAVHGYCCSHYRSWQSEHPEAAARLKPGGFGENLVLRHMNERNVCIGDVVAVGTEGLVLQVSLPRQPCFKLNHRFELKNFAPSTWRLSRTGWYYRVLEGGRMRAGDEVRLLRRPNPDWTIKRVQEYLHRNTDDTAMNEALAAVEELGAESRGQFQRRVAKAKAAKAKKAEAEEGKQWRDYRVVERTRQTPRIASFVLEPAEQLREFEDVKYGAHARIKLGNGLVRAYSVVEGGTPNRLTFGIAREEEGRGGSRYLHENVKVGDTVQVGRITRGVPSGSAYSNHVYVAGGVGITAFLAHIQALVGFNYSCKLHYAVRSADDIPFRERIGKLADSAIIYDASKGERLSIRDIIATAPWNSHFNFCGPRRMMDEAAREVRAAGLAEGDVHFEAFEADISGDPFEAVVANRGGGGGSGKGGEVLIVGEDETLLEVMRRRFGADDIASSCEVGNCGTCKVALKEGRVDHRGTALMEEEKCRSMLSCVSRGVGRIVIEI